jgi:hypothetical protein
MKTALRILPKTSFLIVVILALGCVSVQSGSGVATVSGLVERRGAGVAGLTVIMDSFVKQTDESGRFEFDQVPFGSYTIRIRQGDATVYCTRIDVSRATRQERIVLDRNILSNPTLSGPADEYPPGWFRTNPNAALGIGAFFLDGPDQPGSRVLHIKDVDEKSYGVRSEELPAYPGVTYTAMSIARVVPIEAGYETKASMTLEFIDANRKSLHITEKAARTDQWEQLVATAVAPENTAAVRIVFYSGSIYRGDNYYRNPVLRQGY